jgi:hypothetical protein
LVLHGVADGWLDGFSPGGNHCRLNLPLVIDDMLDISEREAVKAMELASALLHVKLGPLLGLEKLEAEQSEEAEAEGQHDFDQ